MSEDDKNGPPQEEKFLVYRRWDELELTEQVEARRKMSGPFGNLKPVEQRHVEKLIKASNRLIEKKKG